MKRSNQARSVPTEPPRAAGIDYEAGETIGNRSRTALPQASSRRSARIAGSSGSVPVSGRPPRPPPVLVLYDDLVEPEDLGPAPVYGQYPRALIGKLLPWLRCARHEILHVCSGSLPAGEGIRVDVRPEARPDILADGRALPLRDGAVAAVETMDGILDEADICRLAKSFPACGYEDGRAWYAATWEHIHGSGSWERDRGSWVFATTFRRMTR